MARQARRWVVAVMALAVVAAGCGDDGGAGTSETPNAAGSSTTAGAPQVCTAARKGGTVTMAVAAEVRGLDPVVEPGTGLSGDTENAAIYDTLVRWDASKGDYVPQLAESLTPNADSSQWTLKLRAGVKFGNGDPLDATAVKASVERHKDPANRSTKAGQAANIAAVRVVDERTVVFDLTGPWGRFPYLLAGQVGMITNPRLVAERGKDLATNPAGAGAGPFEFERFAPGEEIRLKAKSDYWGGTVCVDTLRFVSLGTATQSYEGLKAGTVDATIITDAAVVARATADGFGGPRWLQNMGGQILINNGVRNTTPATKDVRVRQAVAFAIDPAVINQRAFDGKADATSAIFAKSSRYFQGLDGPPYDVNRSKALVQELKAAGSWDGSLRLVCANNRADESLAIKALLEAAGITVKMDNTLPQAQQIAKVITDADYDLACWGNNMYDDGDPWAVLDSQLRSNVASNYRGYANAQWDAAVTELKKARTLDETKVVLKQLQQIWNESIPSMNYRSVENFAPLNPKLHGVMASQEGVVLFGAAFLG
jgi:peptide/nickel transport system substrate-binding protein